MSDTFKESLGGGAHYSDMPRLPRVVLPGVAHHVTQRGNNRQTVFFCDQDRTRYLQMLRSNLRRYDIRILGWCLMTNHVHLIAIPGAAESLTLCLKLTHWQYSLELNQRRERVGHLWQNRFYSCPLGSTHLLAAMHYVDLNPVRAGMSAEAWDWRWSSARAHASQYVHDGLLDWPWLDWVAEARLGTWSYPDWRARLLAAAGSAEDLDRVRRCTRVGEPLGSDEFVADLEMKTGRRLRVRGRGRPYGKKSAEAAAGI